MVKMEFLKRKHFSLWIITTFVLVAGIFDCSAGLQGVPTWITLGLKSPFIEFSNDLEVLANNSVPLNITKDEQVLMHQEGLRRLGAFIKPVDLRDSETGYVKADLTKKVPSTSSGRLIQRRPHIIQEEMDQKQIILLDEDTDENGLPASLTDEDRKFIVPMALKNAAPDPRVAMQLIQRPPTARPITTSTTTARTTRRMTTPLTPVFASNIDDLKNHILFLQNLTKHDSNFQSKFVVFPSLQKEKQSTTTTTTMHPVRPFFQYSAPIVPTTRRSSVGTKNGSPFGGYYHNEEEDSMSVFLQPTGNSTREKITIVPQVLLLNDQTSNSAKNDQQRRNYGKPNAFENTTTSSTTTTPPTPTTTTSTTRRTTKRPACLRNPDSPKCIRQRKREELQRQRDREQLLREQSEYLQPRYEPWVQTINNTKRFAVSIEIPDSFKIPLNETEPPPSAPEDLQILSRAVRSHHKRRNIGGGLQGRAAGSNKFASKYSGSTYFERDEVMSAGGRDFLISNGEQIGNAANTNTTIQNVATYSEPIDLNPDNCYQVDGLSYGQKKQCVLHTSVMPAISRGARATIQECQFQFNNRRWNCSTTDDNTVFGPMTGLGSPEMAFIHALSAAMVTSFIARACRDGQLASCGCSRGSRPKQLHDDWAWGGCGDNLEYAYKFATDFIDIREKETKRGTRGAGNPERKRGRAHQRRIQQQQQQMLADDAAATFMANNNSTTTIAMIKKDMKILPKNPTEIFISMESAQINNTNNTNNNNSSTGTSNFNKTVNVVAAADNKSDIENSNKQRNDTILITTTTTLLTGPKDTTLRTSSVAPPKQEDSSEEDDNAGRIKPEDLLELQERITKEILNSKLQEKEMLELQEKINREILNSKIFNMEGKRKRKRKNQRAVNGIGGNSEAEGHLDGVKTTNLDVGGSSAAGANGGKAKNGGGMTAKARSLMNLHNNEAGRRAVIKKTRITCKCHGVSGSCSLITCWQQLSSIREIGDFLREKYEESTEVKLNKRGRLQVKNPYFKVPTAHDLVYLDESPDWCRNNRQLQWPGTHGRRCNKTSSGLDGCGILCCGRGYNTKNIVVRERCNCKFHWCCQVKCDVCQKVLEEHTCK